MNRFKFLMLASIVALFFYSCGATKGTQITGKIGNAPEMSIFLDKVGLSQVSNIRIAAEKTSSDGGFKFSIPEGIQKGIYRVTLGAKAFEFIAEGTEKKVDFQGDLNTLDRMELQVTGSKLTEEYVATIQKLIKKELEPSKVIEMASKESDPLLGFMLASRLFGFNETNIDMHKKVLGRLKDSKLDFLSDYQNIVDGLEKQAAIKEASSLIKVGMDAPEIALPGVDGKVKKLSAYKGKVVLIDFWASWCGPCRKANPEVVEIYNKYKAKGFDVFSVSLDGVDDRTRQQMNGDASALKQSEEKQKERWLGAIAQDNLTWPGHVSDLKKWNSKAAATYGVSSIPKTFLVGKDGKISAIDPRFNLEEAILKVL